MLGQVLNDHARQGNPELANRLVSMLLSRIVQADTGLGRDERCSQIPSEYLFFAKEAGASLPVRCEWGASFGCVP
jgi:hypothetical protein